MHLRVRRRILFATTAVSLIVLTICVLWFFTDWRLMNREVLYVPGDCPTIQKAIDLVASGGTVRVSPGIYRETLTIKKNVNLIGDDKTSTIIEGPQGTDILINLRTSNIRITGFTIRGAGRAIFSSEGRYCVIENNIITNNSRGVYLDSSDSNRFINNTVTNNDIGIWFMYSDSTYVINNTVANNGVGLLPDGSYNCVIKGNRLSNNRVNLQFNYGIFQLSWDVLNQVDSSNTINGKNIYYLNNQSNTVIDPSSCPNAAYMVVMNSVNVTVRNLRFSNNDHGLMLLYTHNSTLENIDVSNNAYGITLFRSHNNSIIGCTSLENTYGLQVLESQRCLVQRCNLTRNRYDAITLQITMYCKLNSNIVEGGTQTGMRVDNSNHTAIHNNTIRNMVVGMYITYSFTCDIRLNTLEHNSYSAIVIWSKSKNNEICENTITYNNIGIEYDNFYFFNENNIHDNIFAHNKRNFYYND